jgi:16S rRNA (cytosine967-C5)-methyltransferase
MPVTPARAMAFDILMRVEGKNSFASELLHSSRYAELSTEDHALATELVMGVLRWRSRLDEQIAQISAQPVAKLDVEVLTALRLAAYQLGWLDRIPDRAAINESVELVKRARKRSAVPFANAVLRRLAATKTGSHVDGFAPIEASDSAIDRNAEQAQPGSTTAKTLAAEFAHPPWIVERWVNQFDLETARSICKHDQQVPRTTIRLRDLSCEDDLRKEGVKLAGGDFLTSARRVVSGDVTQTRVFQANRLAIQDEASQLVAALVGNGKRILDGCAAPGGKTWSIADHNPEATITAVELHPHRAALLRKRVAAPNVQVIQGDLQQLPGPEMFDRVLLDVPCSGTGTLARNPEIKWRLSRQDLRDLAATQLILLRVAMKHVAAAGRLIYSTCSIEFDEDEAVIEQALSENGSFRPIDCLQELERLRAEGEWTSSDAASFVRGPYLRTIPGVHRCDGFFAAIIEREKG